MNKFDLTLERIKNINSAKDVLLHAYSDLYSIIIEREQDNHDLDDKFDAIERAQQNLSIVSY